MERIVFGASVQGASHLRTGTECQDSYKKIKCDDGTVIMAVADGHGSDSCPYSKTGSMIAVNVFCQIMEELHNNYIDNHETLLTYLNREGDTKFAQSIDMEWKRRVLKKHTDHKRPPRLTDDGQKNRVEIYKQYGTTLVGLMITPSFLFAFQIGDGDMTYVDKTGLDQVLHSDKILGIETHSLSKADAWKRAISVVRMKNHTESLPCLYMLSTDGFANSYKDEQEFQKTCVDYFEMIRQHGSDIVDNNLKQWLTETSEMGCGDDITLLMAYFPDCTGITGKSLPIEEKTKSYANSEVPPNEQNE